MKKLLLLFVFSFSLLFGAVNINTASKEELMSLKGIGETTANNIIEYRKENKFKKIEDLKNVKGIGDKKFEAIKDDIKVEGK
ncbi:helix-hairpin-helix domain-containing protein [uncultured Campylobacter sp.]|uniref:ComEA family DNA-binding protein n=1 Tax=uncultured Campylobacter sp. TaxID=218934 RepID=UPI0026250851|nr:helix-hairpin-helix domain-containing protein [uncultured Campylobacter sp.]